MHLGVKIGEWDAITLDKECSCFLRVRCKPYETNSYGQEFIDQMPCMRWESPIQHNSLMERLKLS
jgi:hypothetical protein